MHNGHTQLNTLGSNTAVDPFGNNAPAALAYKRAERLVTATHMVTNYVPSSESLRERVRSIAGELLSDTIKLRNGFTSLGKGTLERITAQVRLLLSLLDALYASGLISEMNLRVLKEAYIDFIKSLSAMSSASASDGVELTKSYFTQVSSPDTPEPIQAQAKTLKAHKALATNSNNPAQGIPQKQVRVSSRMTTIVDFITKRGTASVGDIAQLITNCSSKTLQRDLGKLVASGTLLREGAKRWTKYSLAR